MPERGRAFERVFEQSLDGVLLMTLGGTILRANPAACRVLGRTEEELCRVGREGLGVEGSDVRDLLAPGGSTSAAVGELIIRRPDGTTVPLELTSGVLPSEDGAPPLAYVILRDVTGQRRLEEALRQREHLLEESQRLAHVGSWSRDLDADVIGWSAEAYRIFGVSPGGPAPTPESFLALIHPDDRPAMQEWLRACTAGEGPGRLTFRTVRSDGSTRVLEGRGELSEPIFGSPRRMAGTVQDVTDRARAEEEAQRATSRLELLARASRAFAERGHDHRAVLDQLVRWVCEAEADSSQVRLLADDGQTMELVALHSRDPEVSETLRALEELLPERARRSPAGEQVLRGEPVLFPVITLEQVKAVKPAETWPLYERFPPRSAIVVPLRVRGRVVGALGLTRYRPERPAFTQDDVGLAQDLADRAALTIDAARQFEQAERELAERRRVEADHERLTMAIGQVAETVIVTDAQGTIVYVNPAFEAVTGYPRAEVLGKNPRILKSGAQDAAFYRVLWDAVTAGRTWHGRLVNRKKDGTLYTEDATISPVRDATGAITSYVAVKRDITRDLALEAQLLQSQKLESIGRLAGGVAHDFNNILSVILSCAELALEGTREGDPLREDLLQIEKAANRAASLTGQLLAFSRKQLLQAVPLDLNKVLSEMEKMLHRILGEDIELVQLLAPDLGIVKADPGQVEQVIMNLAINARDAMPAGGRLTIETANVELDAEAVARLEGIQPGRYVEVAVTDSGVGMDEATVARIFEPFFTTKELGKGTGLGLSTVYGIVKQSGGGILVESRPGGGTTFEIYLPWSGTPAETATRATQHPKRPAGAETILVVEDEESVRAVAKRILSAAGYAVLTAANGGEGLLLCEQHPGKIDLVLTDVVMPRMGGRLFVERLAGVRPEVKVLFMSGYTDDAMLQHRVADAGTRFIAKPLTQVELLRKVRAVLDE